MSRVTGRAFAIGVAFALLGLLGTGVWAAWRRAALNAPLATDAREDARAVLAFCAEREPTRLRNDLIVRARLEDLVAERGLVGAIVLDADGDIVARAGELDPPVMSAALEDVSAKPGTREVGQRVLYREPAGDLVAVVVEDRGPVDAAWRPIRNWALGFALGSVVLAPLVGLLLAKRSVR